MWATATRYSAVSFCSAHQPSFRNPLISVVFCHSDWSLHGKFGPRAGVLYPRHMWSSSPVCTTHCSLHNLFLQPVPCSTRHQWQPVSFSDCISTECGGQADHSGWSAWTFVSREWIHWLPVWSRVDCELIVQDTSTAWDRCVSIEDEQISWCHRLGSSDTFTPLML